jgi:hypothetical protein
VNVSRAARLCLVAAVALSGCSDDDSPAESDGGSPTGHTIVTVAELQPLAERLADGYNDENPEVEVGVRVGSRRDAVRAAGAGGAIVPAIWLGPNGLRVTPIGRTLSVIIVPAGNPAQVGGVDAFAAGAIVSSQACGANSLFGNFAELVIRLGGREPDRGRVGTDCAADAVGRVAEGRLDAALVFRDDAAPLPPNVETVAVPDDQNIIIDVAYAPAGGGRTAFADWLGSDAARQILTEAGYLP